MYDLINFQIEHAMADYPANFEIVDMTENTVYININTYRKSYNSPRFQDKVIEQLNKLNVLSGRRVFCVVRNNEEWVRVDELLHEDGKFIEYKAHGYEAGKKNIKSLPDINKELIDFLPSLKVRGFQRRPLSRQPWRVPASTRLPRGTELGFRFQIPTVGNFTATSQPAIPPGLTASPQADTACPAAKETLEQEIQKGKKIPATVRLISPP